mmetsp:Transcript_23150/g.60226  ORF Transcript_23150/g.60226 Transcript_23150/m.60226 type:complete len:141 (-) Transcript_23150:133-555(-)
MGQRRALAAALVLAACSAKKASKVKATKPPNEYSTKNTTIAASPWRRKGAVFEEIGPGRFALFGGKVKDPRANDGRAAYAGDAWLLTVRRLTVANDSVQLAIALVVAFLVTGAALRARFRHDDAYDGPPGVQASPYVGVA